MKHSATHPFDRRLQRHRLARCASNIAAHDFLHRIAAEALLERRADIKRDLPRGLLLGSAETSLAAGLRAMGIQLVVSDMLPAFVEAAGIPGVVLDEEFLPFAPASFDIIASNLLFQTVNDLPGVLRQCHEALAPGGVFLTAMLGGTTLQELRHSFMLAEQEVLDGVSPRVLPMVAADSAAALLQRAGFILPVVDSTVITVTYPDVLALMRDLRGMGLSNILHNRWPRCSPKALFARLAAHYMALYPADEGGIRASFELIFLHGWSGAKPALSSS